MTKIETLTFEYEACEDCSWCEGESGEYKCGKANRILKNIYTIAKFCPLEDKK